MKQTSGKVRTNKDTATLVKEALEKLDKDHEIQAKKSEEERLYWLQRYKEKREEARSEKGET